MKKLKHISQSFINDAMHNDVCPKYLQYKYVDKIPREDEEQGVMFRGQYFEWHLLGATRDGKEPIFKRRLDGKKYQSQIDLDNLILYARDVLRGLNLNTQEGEKQLYIVSEDLNGHIDWKTRDITDKNRKALYDVKYTETGYDDRYNGWADIETKTESKIQACQYIILEYLKSGEYLPFYFLIFGISMWCRVIKIELTSDGLFWHERAVNIVKEKIEFWQKEDWPAAPEFNKCMKCDYGSFCKFKELVPKIEIYSI